MCACSILWGAAEGEIMNNENDLPPACFPVLPSDEKQAIGLTGTTNNYT
jgi:hypothetical protein